MKVSNTSCWRRAPSREREGSALPCCTYINLVNRTTMPTCPSGYTDTSSSTAAAARRCRLCSYSSWKERAMQNVHRVCFSLTHRSTLATSTRKVEPPSSLQDSQQRHANKPPARSSAERYLSRESRLRTKRFTLRAHTCCVWVPPILSSLLLLISSALNAGEALAAAGASSSRAGELPTQDLTAPSQRPCGACWAS